MANQFNRNVGKGVLKKDAQAWINTYQQAFPKDTRSVFYGRDALEKILSNQEFTGISFFFCRKVNEPGAPYNDLVLVGTYEDGSLAWDKGDSSGIQTMDDPDGGYNNGLLCPPNCPK